MPPLTNPTAITVILTCTALTAALLIITVKYAINLRKFRQNIKPGDYANIEKNDRLIRCKLVNIYGDHFMFRAIDNREAILTTKRNIYPL